MSKTKQLEKLLKYKKSKEWYADKLGTTVARIDEMLGEIRGTSQSKGLFSEKVEENGDKQVEFISDKPLDRAGIEKLYGIDGVTTRLSTYWNKQTPNGKYLVSALIKVNVEDFYSIEELEIKLREIFPKVDPVAPRKINFSKQGEEAVFIYISDDHCGNDLKNSIYNKEYTGKIYEERLMGIADSVINWDRSFEKVFIVNLGDELDGWNGKTTRLDHDLDGSLSNKEQFDIYTTGRKKFYDAIFDSGLGESYSIISLNNSNHTGRGLSYIANKALEFHIEGKYPDVEIINISKFIDVIEWGDHLIGLTHGKDEKLMKSPLPLNLDAKTDLWLFEFYDKLGYSPSDYYVSTVKGDIHKYNFNTGKSGRYVNVPSIAGGSTWIELNFGDTRAGALVEIIEKHSPNIMSIPIWFN